MLLYAAFHCIERPLVTVSKNLDPASMKQRFLSSALCEADLPKEAAPRQIQNSISGGFLGNQAKIANFTSILNLYRCLY